MKKFYTLLVLIVAMFAISTSIKAQESQYITVTPAQVNLTNQGGPLDQELVIQIRLLNFIGVLQTFDVTLEGENASQFVVEVPELSLADIIQELIGGGRKVYLKYRPTTTGTHTATLRVKARILNAGINPLIYQKTVPVTATSIAAPYITSTNPSNGSTNVAGNSPINIFFNENITIADASKITVNGEDSWATQSRDNYINMFKNGVSPDTEMVVLVKAGSVRGNNNNLNVKDYSFTFRTDAGPQLVSVTPADGSVLNFSDYGNGTPIEFEFYFDRPVTIGGAGKFVSNNPSYTISQIRQKPIDINHPEERNERKIFVYVVYQQPLIPSLNFTITAEMGSVWDYATMYKGGSWQYSLNLLTRSIEIDETSLIKERNMVSEHIYNISGIEVVKSSLMEGNMYIKRIIYDDGSEDTQKFIYKMN